MASSAILMNFTALTEPLKARHLPFGREDGFSSVSIDSRTVEPGALFVALTGVKADGHAFVKNAFNAGAVAAMVNAAMLKKFDLENIAQSMGKDLIIVDNTLKGLQNTARIYLEGFPNLLKIGITGSSGKTTTKEIIAAIIGTEKKVVMNQGNLNSDTGLPLSVFSVRNEHEVGVFELGTNRKGEIAETTTVLKPNIAVITNIGTAHIGIIGSKRAIAEEKKNIFSCFTGTELALIPAGDEYRDFLANGIKGRVSFYSAGTFTELGEVRQQGLWGTQIDWAGETAHFALPGKHNFANALAALAVAKELAITPMAVKRGLESVKALFGRSEIINGDITVIRDCYNANPESLEMAVEFCDSLEWPGRKIYVIADMLEMGSSSREVHKEAGKLLESSGADKVFLFGNEIRSAISAGQKKEFFHTCDFSELSEAFARYVQKGDIVLLKGSRACALERLCDIPAIKGEAA